MVRIKNAAATLPPSHGKHVTRKAAVRNWTDHTYANVEPTGTRHGLDHGLEKEERKAL